MHPVAMITLSLLTTCINAQERVRMTLLSKHHFNSQANGEYQCHLSYPDTYYTTVTSFRAVHTRNGGVRNNEEPPYPSYQRRDTYRHYKITLNDNGNDRWFGVLGCQATKRGKMDTRISTTRMRSDADFVPENHLFTQTVNVGDEGVSITMYSPTGKDTNGVQWRKDNVINTSQTGRATFAFSRPIQQNDAGTYECHYVEERNTAKQGLKLLLVRACPASRWSPPNCLGVCDSCYNGGICDENNGKCVCSPGFMGDKCRQACGGNKYGHSCDISCSSSDGVDSCGSYLFCLVHPFGCRCNTGWKGLGCNTACQANTFGASCLQSCNCKSNECNRYTGRCTGVDTRCKERWTGNNCQECFGNYFGKDCTQECHCRKENCHRESGLCSTGGCLPQWVDMYPPYSCQTGLQNITYTKMNPNVPVPVICQAVEGTGGDLSSLDLVLSKDSEVLENNDITPRERSQDGTTGYFAVANIYPGDMLHCQLRNGGTKLAVLSLSVVEIFVLPVLPSAPVKDSVDGSSVTISWSAWDKDTDQGDPPVVGYIPYYKATGGNGWRQTEMVSSQTLLYTYTSLNPETDYSFSISAVREGDGGEGPKSPELSVRTICDVPPKPEGVTATVSGEHQENIRITWQLPSEGISCSSGVMKFNVFYSWGTKTKSVDVLNSTATSITLFDLTPGELYTISVTLGTSGGMSGRSDVITHLVPILPSLTNPPTLPDITCNSVTMVWEKWTDGIDEGTPPTTLYIPYYKMHVETEWISGEKVNHTNGDGYLNITFYNLTENTSYDFSVMPVREGYGGEGHPTTVQGDTPTCKGEGGLSPVVVAIPALSAMLFLLVILAVVIIVRRKEKEKPVTNVYEASGETNGSYCMNTHEPRRFPTDEEQKDDSDNEALYTNLQKPVSISIADLEKYITDCGNSKLSNFHNQFELLNGCRQFSSHVGEKEQNKTKNRFKNMIAYDHSRVVLDVMDGDPHSDYYNASYIKNAQSEVAYIACQGPNRASVGDFWQMVWQESVSNIVMLTNLIENGKDRCIQYWPSTVGATKRFGKISIKLESEEQFADYNVRELQVTLDDNIRSVTNWHFKTWPDKNVPDQPSSLLEFVRRIKPNQKTAPGHLLVHCSAGVGRTGTFIALFTLMDVIESDTKIDIYGYVERMRQDRIKMVQTETQYRFLHECLLEILLAGNTKIQRENMTKFSIEAEKENLKKQFKILAKLDKRSMTPHTETQEESEKSRYPKIIPVYKKRPFLQTPGKTSSSSYINACFVKSYRKKDAFIATQSPLPSTVEDFWRLVYDWKCPLIVMLNQVDPRDKTCCKYWPENNTTRFGNMTVTLKEERNVGIYVQRQIELTDAFSKEPRLVRQMQLNSWNQQDLMVFVHDVERIQQGHGMMMAPTVVHCINGVGRTGVFLTVKSEMERMSAEENYDVFNTVRQLRGSNHSMVYTAEDYYLCHQLLSLRLPGSHYANV